MCAYLDVDLSKTAFCIFLFKSSPCVLSNSMFFCYRWPHVLSGIMQRKRSKEVADMRRDDLLRLQIKHIWEKPLLHSALEMWTMLAAANRFFSPSRINSPLLSQYSLYAWMTFCGPLMQNCWQCLNFIFPKQCPCVLRPILRAKHL